jgi:S1-C subfamily serine protease
VFSWAYTFRKEVYPMRLFGVNRRRERRETDSESPEDTTTGRAQDPTLFDPRWARPGPLGSDSTLQDRSQAGLFVDEAGSADPPPPPAAPYPPAAAWPYADSVEGRTAAYGSAAGPFAQNYQSFAPPTPDPYGVPGAAYGGEWPAWDASTASWWSPPDSYPSAADDLASNRYGPVDADPYQAGNTYQPADPYSPYSPYAPYGGAFPGAVARRRPWVAIAGVAALIGASFGGGVGFLVAHNTAAGSGLGLDSSDIPKLLGKVEPGVVTVVTQVPGGEDAGTGMIVSPGGLVVTNYHVVEGASSIPVTILHYGKKTAVVQGFDSNNDVAVLQVEGVGRLPTIPLGDSSTIKVGDPVIAVGNALDLPGGPTVTAGIVSATGRTIPGVADNGENIPPDLIQTDAAINPGNSGGPLVNGRGQVVGMNSLVIQQATQDESAQGLGFAIPIDTVKALLPSLSRGDKVAPAYLGVGVQDDTAALSKEYGIAVSQGAIVTEVVSDGPADTAGIEPYDVITALDHQSVKTASDLVSALAKFRAGDTVVVSVVRGSRTLNFTVMLAPRPLSEEG